MSSCDADSTGFKHKPPPGLFLHQISQDYLDFTVLTQCSYDPDKHEEQKGSAMLLYYLVWSSKLSVKGMNSASYVCFLAFCGEVHG